MKTKLAKITSALARHRARFEFAATKRILLVCHAAESTTQLLSVRDTTITNYAVYSSVVFIS